VGDPLAVDRLGGEDGVGVQRVEVPGDAGEGDEIGLRDRTARCLEPEADLDVLEVERRTNGGSA
jgi:hypothetical protein